MGMTREEAFSILELTQGASHDEIRASYKRLALLWHPDKHSDAEEATKKFQQISCAYKKLTTEEDEEDVLEFDVFELFKMMFFTHGGMFSFRDFNGAPMDIENEDYYYTDDEDYMDSDDYFTDEYDYNDEEDFEVAANRLHMEYRSAREHDVGWERFQEKSAEAQRIAEELIKQEEDEKKEAHRKEEKRKAKNKKKKEAKKKKKKQASSQGSQPSGANGSATNTTSGTKSSSSKKKKGSSGVEKNLEEKTKQAEKEIVVKEEEEVEEVGVVDEIDEADWDMSSAFVRGRANGKASVASEKTKKTKMSQPQATNSTEKITSTVGQATTAMNGTDEGEVGGTVTQARYYAMRGNEMAQRGHYQAAVDLFTEAIKLHSGDQRYYGNRSFCFDCLTQHGHALQDADTAIKLAPEWPKGYYRRGKALCGLKRWKDAEEAFELVLALDPSCMDALEELTTARAYQLHEMGFSLEQASVALQRHKTVAAALDALLSGAIVEQASFGEMYVSDDDDFEQEATPGPLTTEQLQLPNPDNGVQSLWVGNVNASLVTQADLEQLFSQYGVVSSVRIFPARKYAFVNFANSRAAATAMRCLQGYFIGNANLIIRYPNSAASSGQKRSKKPTSSGSATNGWDNGSSGWDSTRKENNGWDSGASWNGAAGWDGAASGSQHGYERCGRWVKTGPAGRAARKVNGLASSQAMEPSPSGEQECVYWRTKGCVYGKKCRNLHIPEHKGIDLTRSSSRGRR